jgi:hypothetical protein
MFCAWRIKPQNTCTRNRVVRREGQREREIIMFPICFFLCLFFVLKSKFCSWQVHICFSVPGFGWGKGDELNAVEDGDMRKFAILLGYCLTQLEWNKGFRAFVKLITSYGKRYSVSTIQYITRTVYKVLTSCTNFQRNLFSELNYFKLADTDDTKSPPFFFLACMIVASNLTQGMPSHI